MIIIRVLGSMRAATVLTASLIIVLVSATLLEAAHGTPLAHRTVYGATWFFVFLGCFALNILCAIFNRIPFRMRHTGFLLTHVGILVLLVGSLIVHVKGVEGQVTLFEGERWNQMRQPGYEIRIRPPHESALEGQEFTFPVPDPSFINREHQLALPGLNARFTLLEIQDDAVEEMWVRDGGEIPNRAVKLTLFDKTHHRHHSFWLVESDPDNPFSDEAAFLNTFFRLETLDAGGGAVTPTLNLYIEKTKRIASINLSPPPETPIQLEKSDLTITSLSYFPSAKVVDNKIIDYPESVEFNPAVEFEIQDTDGHTEHHTRFFLFPHFYSLHGKESPDHFNLNVELDVPVPSAAKGMATPTLTFYIEENGLSYYEILQPDGRKNKNRVRGGDRIEAAFSGMSVMVNQILTHARVSRVIRMAQSEQETGRVAARIASALPDGTGEAAWVFPGKPAAFNVPGGHAHVSIGPRTHMLPFYLLLNDFRKIDYPGTGNPSSFESDVTLYDPLTEKMFEQTVSMNKPLDYKKYRVFQSEYIMDPHMGEASVFTVAKKPGTVWIYTGLAMLMAGMLITFYGKKLFE